jgi:hypothetical protein
MLSEKQLEANRANAQKSTGPKSTEGKERSRLNAYRHGLTAQVLVMTDEDMQAYNKFTADLVAAFSPADANERQLAQSYATLQWRINRAAALEENMLTLGLMEEIAENFNIDHPQAHNAATYAKAFRHESAEFARLCMYSQRLISQSDKVLKQLKQFQSDRKQHEDQELEEAIVIYQAHSAQGLAFDPKANGFVLTVARIKDQIHRRNLSNPTYISEIARRAS